MIAKDLQNRTKIFALRIIKLVQFLEKDSVGKIIGKQILRCGTSVAANYRAVCRAKSVKDFISKLAIVIEEADEAQFWLELLLEAGLVKPTSIEGLLDEANQITAIMVSSRYSTLQNQKAKSKLN